MAVREHPRGVELPQGSLSVLLRRASKDLVVVGEAQQAYHLGQRQDGFGVLTVVSPRIRECSVCSHQNQLCPLYHMELTKRARFTGARLPFCETRV